MKNNIVLILFLLKNLREFFINQMTLILILQLSMIEFELGILNLQNLALITKLTPLVLLWYFFITLPNSLFLPL